MPSFSKVGKWRRRLRWVSWTALSLLILIGTGAGLLWYSLERTAAEGKKLLAEAIAETDGLDPRWRWEQIEEDLAPIPNAENSMRVIDQMVNSLESRSAPEFPDEGQEILEDWPENRQLDEEKVASLRNFVNKREKSLKLGSSLKDFPRGRTVIELNPDLLSTPLQHPVDCRLSFWLLRFDSEELLQQGRYQDAVDRIRSILNAAGALREDSIAISQLVRMAGRAIAVKQTERLLGMGAISDDQIGQLMAEFKAEQNDNLMLTIIRGERASWHFLFENLHSGRLTFAEFIARAIEGSKSGPNLLGQVSGFIYEAQLYEEHAFLLNWINEAWKIILLPASEQLAAWKDWDRRLATAIREARAEEVRLIIAPLGLTSLLRFAERSLQDQARLSCLLAALAAERYRIANKRWPKDSQELVPAYLPEVPIDPFDGKPLKFAQREDGIVIYSVDKDGLDNGGDIHQQSPEGDNPKDLGVRLWNPDHRRLPPLPKKKEQPNDDDNGGS